MKNNFKYNKLFTIGIEEEYMLCNPITGDLTNKAHKVMNNLDDQYIDRYSYELLLSEIESNTSVCNDVNQCINEIVNLRNNLKEISEGEGDLTQKIEVSTNDEIGDMADYFNKFVDSIRLLIKQISDTTIELKALSESSTGNSILPSLYSSSTSQYSSSAYTQPSLSVAKES